MATHKITLTTPQEGWQQVGNSMSTVYRWDGETATLNWKDGREMRRLPAKAGDRVMVVTDVRTPEGYATIEAWVMKPPADPVARAAWERGFYRGKRFATLQDLERVAWQEQRTDRARGCTVPACRVYQTENAAFAYRAAMGGWFGVPFGWWAGEAATADEVTAIIDAALSRSASAEYGDGSSNMTVMVDV